MTVIAETASARTLTDGQTTADAIVSAFKVLGGIGHIDEITEQCARQGHPHPSHSIRARLQENSSDAVWDKAQKPRNARDLFYSLDGVDKATGIWGLRNFSVEAPGAYPMTSLARAYYALLERDGTPLGKNNPRGIAYRNGSVRALQVGFAPDSPYPDGLMPNGQIEHIGEGKGHVQTDVGGNRGMLEALERGLEIPVFQAIGKRGKKRYADLGLYRVIKSERRLVRLPENDFDTEAFVFTLEPAEQIYTEEAASEFPPAPTTVVEDVPIEAHYTEKMGVSARVELEAKRREAPLVLRFKQYITDNEMTPIRKRIVPKGETKALYTDMFVKEPNLLVEAKGSVTRIAFRMAIGQIADYRRYLDNPKAAILVPDEPRQDLLDLANAESIGVVWPAGDGFDFTVPYW